MRFTFGVVLALSVGIGAYFGSAQVAGSWLISQRWTTRRCLQVRRDRMVPPGCPLGPQKVLNSRQVQPSLGT
jgi:hypothetical protein